MTFYAFLWQRPQDKTAWPVIWRDRALAEREPFRVSEIVEVELVPKVPTLNHQHRASILERPADAPAEHDHAQRSQSGDGK